MEEQAHRRISRRRFVRGASATTGAVIASGYVKPSLQALGIPGASAAVSVPARHVSASSSSALPGSAAPAGSTNQSASGPQTAQWFSESAVPVQSAPPGLLLKGGGPALWTKENQSLWSQPSAPQWTAAGAALSQPFHSGTAFNTVFTPAPELAGLSMLDVVKYNGPSPQKKTAQAVVTAYLDAAFYGSKFPLTEQQINAAWARALQAPDPAVALVALQRALDNAANGKAFSLP